MIHKKPYIYIYIYIVLITFFIAACDSPKSEQKSKPSSNTETTDNTEKRFKPANKAALVKEIERAMSEHGNEVNLNYIDTSAITDMASLFRPDSHGNTYYGLSAFNGDISEWNVSAVTNMNAMFANAIAFNKDISDWNVGAVQNMVDMFGRAAKFNQDISKWNVASVTSMLGMFADATAFNKDISGWDVSAVQNMVDMFNGATEFKQNLDAWGRKINNKVKASSWFNAYGMFKDSGLAASLPTWCKSNASCKISALSTFIY